MSNSSLENAKQQNQIEETEINSQQWDDSPGIEHVPDLDTEDGKPQGREKKLTEKGKSYCTEIRGKARQNAYSALSTHMEKVRKLLNENKNLKVLEEERDRSDKLKDAFNEAHAAYDEVIDNEGNRRASYLWYYIGDRNYFEMRLKLVEQIHSLQQSGAPKSSQSQAGSIKSGSSRRMKTSISKTSVNSRASSGRSLKLEAVAKTARLKMEMMFLERDSEMRRIQSTTEIAIAEAKERAINEALIDERKEIAINQEPLNPSVSSFIPISTLHHARKPQKQNQKSRQPTLKIILTIFSPWYQCKHSNEKTLRLNKKLIQLILSQLITKHPFKNH